MQWICLSQTSLGQTCVFGKFVSTVGRTNVRVWEVRQYCREDKRLCLGSSSLLLGGQTFVFGKFVSTVGRTNVCVWEVHQYCWEAKRLCLGSSSVLLGGQTFVFGKFVSTVGHDQQNLGRFCWGLTQGWYFAIENYWGLTFFSLGPTNSYAILWINRCLVYTGFCLDRFHC
jgi:hypothetical protein